MAKTITFISAALCPKCVRVKRWLKNLEKNNPEINIVRLNIATQFREIKQFKIKTIPTVIVGDQRLDGWIKEEVFLEAVKKLLTKTEQSRNEN